MPNVIQTVCLPVEAERLWRDIGSFGAVGNWHPMLSAVDSQGDVAGAIRTTHSQDGSTHVELRIRRVSISLDFAGQFEETVFLFVKDHGSNWQIAAISN